VDNEQILEYGFTLEQVVELATVNPAKIIGKINKLGTLQVGAPADVAIFEILEGPIKFVDTRNNFRTGQGTSNQSNNPGRTAFWSPIFISVLLSLMSG